MNDISKTSGETLAKEGDGFLLQCLAQRRARLVALNSQFVALRDTIKVIDEERETLEKALLTKYPQGTNLLYERSLVRVENGLASNYPCVKWQGIKKVD